MTAVAALMLDRNLTLTAGERDLPAPAAGEALVRVEWAGLCGSDLHVLRTGDWVREWPATLGHELCGVVEAAGDGCALAVGDVVVADSRLPVAGGGFEFVGEACPGGFATHCVLPGGLLHRVPDGLDPALAVLAEPLAVALHALAAVDGAPARVAILGHGPIGALVHADARRRFPAATIDVAEPADLRADLARAYGASATTPPTAEPGGTSRPIVAGATGSRLLPGGGATVEAAAALPDGVYDLVLDCAGYGGAFADAVRLAAAGGQVLLLAIAHGPGEVDTRVLVERGLRVTGVNAFDDELPQALALLATDGWRYAPVVTDAVALADAPAAFARQLASPDAVKLLVRP